MNEVSTKLMGGLGNYMFQIACAHAYGLRCNKKDIFSTDDSVLVHKHAVRYHDNILHNVNTIREKNYQGFNVINEVGFNYNEIPIIDGNIYLNGYFQSEKYFKDFENEIRHLFKQPSHVFAIATQEAWDKYQIFINTSENTCSIHVRRGDYLNSPNHHPTQNMNYYMKAIKQMPKDTLFLIFSDDIAWCKENFPDLPEKFKFVEGSEDYMDLQLMSMCKNNIIANSSFSWWGAWLNENPNKIVVAPSNWFGPAFPNHDTKDLYCENWIKI